MKLAIKLKLVFLVIFTIYNIDIIQAQSFSDIENDTISLFWKTKKNSVMEETFSLANHGRKIILSNENLLLVDESKNVKSINVNEAKVSLISSKSCIIKSDSKTKYKVFFKSKFEMKNFRNWCSNNKVKLNNLTHFNTFIENIMPFFFQPNINF